MTTPPPAAAKRSSVEKTRLRQSHDEWLRRRGLPMVIPPARRIHSLFRRIAPTVMFLGLLSMFLMVAEKAIYKIDTFPGTDEELLGDGQILGLTALSLLFLVLALILPVITALVMRRVSPRTQTWLSLLSLVVLFPAQWLLRVLVHAPWVAGPRLTWRAIMMLLLIWGVYVGVGSIVWWALRRAASDISLIAPLATRVLPMLLLTVLFFLFSAETWQLASRLTWWRATGIVAALLALSFILNWVNTDDVVTKVFASPPQEPPEESLRHTPFSQVASEVVNTGPQDRSSFSRGEWVNFVLVPVLAQFIQVLWFTALVFLFFMVFSVMAAPPALQQTWIGHAPLSAFKISHLPVTMESLKVALILAGVSGLSFAVASGSDERYRDRFLRPVVQEVETNLVARDAYRLLYPDSTDTHVSAQDAWKNAIK